VRNPRISLEALDYTTKTDGWVSVLVPYWQKRLIEQERRVRTEERNMIDGKPNRVAHELGVLEGLQRAIKGPESIRQGVKLRSRTSRSPSRVNKE